MVKPGVLEQYRIIREIPGHCDFNKIMVSPYALSITKVDASKDVFRDNYLHTG